MRKKKHPKYPLSPSFSDLTTIKSDNDSVEFYALKKPISLIHQIDGDRNPEKQKGLKIRDRRQLKVKKFGKRLDAPKSVFIAKNPKTGGTQVFAKQIRNNHVVWHKIHSQDLPNTYRSEKDFKKEVEESLVKRFIAQQARLNRKIHGDKNV